MKYLFAAVHTLLIALAAYFCAEVMYKQVLRDEPEAGPVKPIGRTQAPIGIKKTDPGIGKQELTAIVQRNIFNVELEKPDPEAVPEKTNETDLDKLEITNLKLLLWGTVTGGENVFAVIEDKTQRRQSLYQVDDIIQGAVIKKILRQGVVLHHNGKDQILEMEEENRGKPSSPNKSFAPPVAKLLSLPELPHANPDPAAGPIPDDIDSLIKQVKIRPHFSQGEPDGLMLYGIRPNSVFRKIGLRNGDVIKDINGTAVTTAEDSMGLYTEIQDAENATITLLRRGREKQIQYRVQDGQVVITSLPENNG